MPGIDFEQGPIRPPSEAGSLLVRVSRNCPWNRCAFCPVYKKKRFSLRSVDEVLSDLDAMQKHFSDSPRTVFLQDANPLLTKPQDLQRIIEGIRKRFPRVTRITAYARSHTLARRSLDELRRIRKSGLDRLHVGMESGCDQVLDLICKGTTREEQILGGQRAKEAGFELSEYIMPGLGGSQLSEEHAIDSAQALCEIKPDFIRLRTTSVIPGTELEQLQIAKKFIPLREVELVREIRLFLSGLENLSTRLESDHMLNLLMEIRGDLPDDLPKLLSVCDQFLELPRHSQNKFILARRMGWMGQLKDLDQAVLDPRLDEIFQKIDQDNLDVEDLFAELRTRMV